MSCTQRLGLRRVAEVAHDENPQVRRKAAVAPRRRDVRAQLIEPEVLPLADVGKRVPHLAFETNTGATSGNADVTADKSTWH